MAIEEDDDPTEIGDLTLDRFRQALLKSGLLTDEDFSKVLQSSEVPMSISASELAAELIRLGKLTPFQVQMLVKGRGKQLILGNYILLEKLGAGGMGQVFKARHRRMKRVVALKLLPEAMVNSPQAVERFRREVEAAAKLEHANIVTAHDADEAEGRHFLAMQYIEGSDLSKVVQHQGPLPIAQAMHVLIQTAQGLEYAHARGIIHRDIKPGNLLVDARGNVKILDMGLARVQSATDQSQSLCDLTLDGMVMGTVDYMAPEQAENTRSAGEPADVYSLGCTLYYLLTGSVMYRGSTVMEKLLAHREQPIPSLRAARSDVPAELDALFQRLVAKKPAERVPTMTAVLREVNLLKITPESLRSVQAMNTAFTVHQGTGPGLPKTSSSAIDATLPHFHPMPITSKPQLNTTPIHWLSRAWPWGMPAFLLCVLLLTTSAYRFYPKSTDVPDKHPANGEMDVVTPDPNGDTHQDRVVAKWAWERGGVLTLGVEHQGKITGQRVTAKEPLPAIPFRLVSLDLSPVKTLADADLSGIRELANLEYLNLSDGSITAAGLRQLQSLPKLREIYLDRTQIGDAGLRSLGRFPHLAVVLAVDSGATVAGVADLRKALPNARVVVDHQDHHLPQTNPTSTKADVRGSIDVLVWRQDEYDPDTKTTKHAGRRLHQPDALPLAPGDWMRIEVALSTPKYCYVIWIETKGQVTPIYPWSNEDWKQRPVTELPRDRLSIPANPGEIAPLGGGPAGMETLMLLTRDEPLPADFDLAKALGTFPVQKAPNLRSAVWFENGKLLQNEPNRGPIRLNLTEKVLNPVLETQKNIRESLGSVFPYTRAVSFSNKGD